MGFPEVFEPADVAARPLVLMGSAHYPAWLQTQDSATQDWLAANTFRPSAGNVLALPDGTGRFGRALAIIGDAADPASFGHLPPLLPHGIYTLAAESPLAVDPGTLLLGWGLGAYRFNRYLKTGKPMARLAIDRAPLATAERVLAAACLTRDLINTPSEHCGPQELEDEVARLVREHGGKLTVVRGDDLLAQNFPAIHAVGRASHRAPRLIRLDWGVSSHRHVVIVGKGVCFDTGGLDIKPADGMRNMKKDMGGAAHAIALAQLALAVKLPLRITLLVGAVENAIGPNAYRPGEVIATRAGHSIEIDNTDAEGRVVLCDALALAAEEKPALIMDFATLTGAARIALGPDLPALFCNDEALANRYLTAGQVTRDPLWRMPLWRPYLSYLKSGIADLANSGASRMAGCVTAALYLERFIPEGQRWTHVDVYSWNDNDRPGKPAGGEAQGLRAAFAVLQHEASGETPA